MPGLALSIGAPKLIGVIGGLKYLQSQDLLGQVMTSIDNPVHRAFETAYGNTPFIHATGNYYNAVRFIQGRDSYKISATAPYSSFLEYGHGSFGGYQIMERTQAGIEQELDSNLDNIVSNIIGEI